MTIPSNICDREYQKFGESTDGKTAVRTLTEGSFSTSGLSTALKVTNTTVGTIATKLPLLPLTARNSMIIFNKGPLSIFIGNSDVTASGVNEGWELDANSYYSTDITDNIELYAISLSGTNNIKVMELA